MWRVFAPKLKTGSVLRVVAPARSLSLPWITRDIVNDAEKRLQSLGLAITYGAHARELDDFSSSSVKSRIADLHDAFKDESVSLILTVIGGFNSIELLSHIDYSLVKSNPKLLCGYSDITALSNALYAKTGLVTYSGPHFFDFGERLGFEYTVDHFVKCLFDNGPFILEPSSHWSDDRWGKDQENRNFKDNKGYCTVNRGSAEGTIVGGNLVTLQSLFGTQYMPSIKDSILFLEEDHEEDVHSFNRNLASLTLQPDFESVKGIVFGRFQSASGISLEALRTVVERNSRLAKIPIAAGVDFGHTTPRMTFPIGGKCILDARERVMIEILEH
jgi:muramoyltetrapeptide carboxypeptidase